MHVKLKFTLKNHQPRYSFQRYMLPAISARFPILPDRKHWAGQLDRCPFWCFKKKKTITAIDMTLTFWSCNEKLKIHLSIASNISMWRNSGNRCNRIWFMQSSFRKSRVIFIKTLFLTFKIDKNQLNQNVRDFKLREFLTINATLSVN